MECGARVSQSLGLWSGTDLPQYRWGTVESLITGGMALVSWDSQGVYGVGIYQYDRVVESVCSTATLVQDVEVMESIPATEMRVGS